MKFFASNTQTYHGEFLQALLLLQQLFDKIPYFSQPLKSRLVPSKKKKSLSPDVFWRGEGGCTQALLLREAVLFSSFDSILQNCFWYFF